VKGKKSDPLITLLPLVFATGCISVLFAFLGLLILPVCSNTTLIKSKRNEFK
jgi:hypothetical protein